MQAADEAEQQAARIGLYHLLGVLLSAPPEAGTLAALRGAQAPEPGYKAPFGTTWTAFQQAVAGAQPEAMEAEYFRLFIGLGRGELVPYASWYLQGALMERVLAELRSDLRRLGLARREDVREPEDHAAAICQSMGMIIAEPGLSLNQSAFFEAYIRPWMGRFFDDMVKAEGADFYRAVGCLGAHFTELETQYFALDA